MFAGIDNKARKAVRGYVGPEGVARLAKKLYMGVDGKARLCWEAGGRVRAYLYNGVKLPEPPKWDAAASPEAVIVKSTIEDTYFYCGKDMLRVSEISCFIIGSEPTVKNILTDSGWSKTDYWLGITLTQNILWANYNVYYRDDLEDAALAGTLCLAASEPVPLYSYNGVELPELPAASKGYTHLVIGLVKGEYRLYCNSDPHYAGSNGTISILFSIEKEYQLIDGNWVETSEGSISITPVWANHDIYYQTGDALGDLSGTLLLAASEPQPVYI